MGAFFLYKNSKFLDFQAIETVFTKKGFSTPNAFRLGPYTLYLYAKQLVDTPNFFQRSQKTAVFVTGTPIYKTKPYSKTLVALLNDYLDGRIDYDALLGNYALIFWTNDHIDIITDPLNVHHLFHDSAFSCISTSFLAMLCSFGRPLSINRMAFYEKVAKGYIIGPDTLVEDIFQWAPPLSQQPKNDTIKITTPYAFGNGGPEIRDGMQGCLDQQVICLYDYMAAIDALCCEHRAELGLSSGYDSRLLYAAAKKLTKPLALHTHWTKGVHDSEQTIVRQMATLRNAPLHVAKTQPLKVQGPERLTQILEDGLYYYDGRCSHNMGAFSETYTRQYKIITLSNNRVSLNGLGGEIYRNYYTTARRKFNFKKWFYNHIFYVFTPYAFNNPERLDEIYEFILPKMESRLDLNLKGRISLSEVRRYYSELRMPDCDGSNHNAHNQLAFFLTPFIETNVIKAGYQATPYLGVAGSFQSALLSKIDPDVAAIYSHYGFPLAHEPWPYKLKCAVKGYIPDTLEMARKRMLIRKKGLGLQNLEIYKTLVSRSMSMQKNNQALYDFFPEIDWQMCMRDYAQSATAVFLGSLLKRFHPFLKNCR